MDVKIFATTIDEKAKKQIDTLMAQKPFENCKVRIMCDVHAGAGCVIGFTANLGDKVIPNIVGVDIGCGMLTIPLDDGDVDYKKLDDICHRSIPHGKWVHKESDSLHFEKMDDFLCLPELKNVPRLHCSLGSLGGGNHFIEIDKDDEGRNYLVIHTGSRNLGKQVADLYQDLAITRHSATYKNLVGKFKAQYQKEHGYPAPKDVIIAFSNEHFEKVGIPRDLCYLEGEDRQNYLHDMAICQEFAIENRHNIASIICTRMGWEEFLKGSEVFETVHNYIDHESNIVRKGAIRAKLGERVLIPINMRDGSLIATGLGNDDWNESAPHGAGRVLSRMQACRTLSLDDYKAQMAGIYSTTVTKDTIDESPMAYKSIDEIIKNIEPTVKIERRIKSVYNFKAQE